MKESNTHGYNCFVKGTFNNGKEIIPDVLVSKNLDIVKSGEYEILEKVITLIKNP